MNTATPRTNRNTRAVTLKTQTEGQCFGTVCVVLDSRGRQLARTRVVPYRFVGAALALGERLCEEKGWMICDSERS